MACASALAFKSEVTGRWPVRKWATTVGRARGGGASSAWHGLNGEAHGHGRDEATQ
jgi:hypothetical protein